MARGFVRCLRSCWDPELAHLDAETSNRNDAILEELANWNTELKRLNSPALQPGKEVKP
jgi:hypothetical protein